MSKPEAIHIRLSSEERNALERAAARGNKSRSDVVRELILGLEISNDLKRTQQEEARVTRLTFATEIENLRRQFSQALLDLRADLREDQKRTVIAAVEAITGKKVISSGGVK